jgi:Bacterial archaeo-eukaryotic release factor family 10
MTAAEAISSEELRELAEFRASRGVVVSLSLGVDPARAGMPAEIASRLDSLVAQGRREGRAVLGGLGHAERQAFDEDLARAAAEVRSTIGPVSVACFADSPDGLWCSAAMPGRLPDVVKVGRSPYLVPLMNARLNEQDLVAAVSRERGEIYRLRSGRLEELVDLSEQQPRRHRDAEAWRQARLERHVDELARAHLGRIGAELDRLVVANRAAGLILAGEHEHVAALEALLSHDARAAVVGAVRAEAHAGVAELERLVLPLLDQKARQEERAAVERWRSELGEGGRAVQGWTDALAAASNGRVTLLLFTAGAAGAARRCPICGRASPAGESCPVDGARLEIEPDALDLVIRLTLLHGGKARLIHNEAGLNADDGVGALLRF